MSYQHYQCDDHRILSQEEEFSLFDQYFKTTCVETKDELKNFIIEHNLKFAIKCARAYITKYPHVDPADLTGYAMMGLMKSVDKFDHTRGTKFISFSVWWIKNFIIRNVETNESMVRYPANIHREMQEKINKNNITDEITTIFHAINGGYSLDQKMSDDSNSKTFSDILESPTYFSAEDKLHESKLKDIIKQSMVDLNDDERFIIQETFGMIVGEKRSMKSVAEELGITQERVRYIKNNSMKKIKKRLAGLVL